MTDPSEPLTPRDHQFMRRALALARQAAERGEVPVGALVVRDKNGEPIAEAANAQRERNDPTAHAERLALTAAGAAMGRWRLDDCTLYVTLEPCSMCAGAIVLARLGRVVYGAPDSKAGACDSLYRITSDRRLNHRAAVRGGLLAEESAALLADFFQSLRDGPRVVEELP